MASRPWLLTIHPEYFHSCFFSLFSLFFSCFFSYISPVSEKTTERQIGERIRAKGCVCVSPKWRNTPPQKKKVLVKYYGVQTADSKSGVSVGQTQIPEPCLCEWIPTFLCERLWTPSPQLTLPIPQSSPCRGNVPSPCHGASKSSLGSSPSRFSSFPSFFLSFFRSLILSFFLGGLGWGDYLPLTPCIHTFQPAVLHCIVRKAC